MTTLAELIQRTLRELALEGPAAKKEGELEEGAYGATATFFLQAREGVPARQSWRTDDGLLRSGCRVATLWTLVAADSPAAGDRKVQQALWVALLEYAAQGVIEIFTHLPLSPTPATSDVPSAPVCPHLVIWSPLSLSYSLSGFRA